LAAQLISSGDATRQPTDRGVTGAGPYTIYGRIFDEDGEYQDYSSVLGALPTANVQTPSVVKPITITWNDAVDGELGWRVQRSSDGTHCTPLRAIRTTDA
jgi:hypothetical protein